MQDVAYYHALRHALCKGDGMGAWSDRGIRALPVTGQNYRRHEGGSDPGFGIQVTVAGCRTFFYQYTLGGRRRYLRLGTYPDTTLAEARQRCRAARALVDQGIDPQAQAAEVAMARTRGTVAQLAASWIDHLATAGRRSWDECYRSLRKDVLPQIGNLPARDITPAHIRDLLYRLILRGAPTQANRLHSYLHAMFQYALHFDHDPRSLGAAVAFGVEVNPVNAVPKNPAAEHVGQRVLTWDEIREVWHAQELTKPYRLAVRLLLATGGQRSGEITRAAWIEFDLPGRAWLLPAARAKNKRDHVIPLTSLALEVLHDLQNLHQGAHWLFPARHNPYSRRPWNESTLAHAVQDWCRVAGVKPWVPSDLRRTWKTRAGEIGISKLHRDLVQNHTLNDVSTRHYDRYDYLTEKREALEKWCQVLWTVVDGLPT